MSQNDYLKGALLGGLIGGVAALLSATKPGRELRKDLVNGYSSLRERGNDISENIKNKGRGLLHAFDDDDDDDDDDEDDGSHTFLVGGAIGLVLAALVALLLAPQSGEKLRALLGDKYDDIRERAEDFASNLNDKRHHLADQVDDWKDFLGTIVKKLSHKKGKNKQWHIDDILDYAHTGLSLFQQLRNRK